MSIQQIPGLYYGPSSLHGRGVFCTNDIEMGDIIEIAPVLVLPVQERKWLDQSLLYNYYMEWEGSVAIVLGYGCLYNHSDEPKATFILNIAERSVTFKALIDIRAQQEIRIHYHEGNPGKKLWFGTS